MSAPLGGITVPAGDMGLGLCLQCLGELLAGGHQPPRFAVTLAPMVQQVGTPNGAIIGWVAAPACWEHLKGAADQPAHKPLLVATGKL